MTNFFLKLGSIDKKLLMPVIAFFLIMIMNIIDYYWKISEFYVILELYSRSISYTVAIIIPIIEKCRNKKIGEKKEKSRCSKKIFIELFLLYLSYAIYFGVYIYVTSLRSKDSEKTKDYKLSHYKGLCFEEALEIIFIIIVSTFLLKLKLYTHHYIGLIIFVIFSLSIDILFDISFFEPGLFFIFFYCVYLIVDSISITYEKYMMDKLGYSPYIILFNIGLLFLFTAITATILLLSVDGLFYDGQKYKIEGFDDYFEKNDYKESIIQLVYLTGFQIPINILKILTIYYFTQFHTYTTYICIKLFDLLITKKTDYKYFSIIILAFQFLGLLIFLEIIELNFCNLDKNTKRNIESRVNIEAKRWFGDHDIDNESSGTSETNKVELSSEYYLSTEMVGIIEDDKKDEDNND